MERYTTCEKEGKLIFDGGKNWSFFYESEKLVYTLKADFTAVYGFGEKFDSVNQAGKKVKAAVIEKCFYQGEYTYLSMPFFMSPNGFGVYVDTYLEVDFDFTQKGEIKIETEKGSRGETADIYYFEGTPKEIIKQFKDVTARTKVFPKWVYGAWMSANRWKTQKEIEEQVSKAEELGFPHSVIVIEPWSDLTTHYLWSGSTSLPKAGDSCASYEEMDFSRSEQWQNPSKMIKNLHSRGLKVVLWVVPIYAKGSNLETNQNLGQVFTDNDYAEKHKDCVMMPDSTPYLIPHTWCIGSMIPDFTNPDGKRNWISHYRYLMQIGIDGFKTDGGEFMHCPEAVFYDGTTGREGRNAYPEMYIKAFSELVGDKGVVFARAGGQYVPASAVTWAGDQESTWQEFRSVIKAGLSAGLSGVSNWGFDIAGFAGYLPTKALYARAVQAAVFAPVMQWHSEPVSNGRCDFSGAWTVNDRSPWNIADFYKDAGYLKMLKRHFLLRYNLLPYIYNLALEANSTGIPAMRHLSFEFPDEAAVYGIDNQFMLGDALLIAPVTEDYIEKREVYLPTGRWTDLFTGKSYEGGKSYWVETAEDSIPVFFRRGKCAALNLKDGKIASDVGNGLSDYSELTFLTSGSGTYFFKDDIGNDIETEFNGGALKVVKNTLNTKIYHIQFTGQKLF